VVTIGVEHGLLAQTTQGVADAQILDGILRVRRSSFLCQVLGGINKTESIWVARELFFTTVLFLPLPQLPSSSSFSSSSCLGNPISSVFTSSHRGRYQLEPANSTYVH